MASGTMTRPIKPQKLSFSGTTDASGTLLTDIPSANKTILDTLTAVTNRFTFAVRIGDLNNCFRFKVYDATQLTLVPSSACVIYIDCI